MEGFYLGIDNGGSWIKVIIFDKKGKEILNKRQREVMELGVRRFVAEFWYKGEVDWKEKLIENRSFLIQKF